VAPPLQMPRLRALPVAYTTLALFFLLAAMLILRAAFGSSHPRRVLTPAMTILVLALVYASGCGGGGRTVQPPSNSTLTITGVSAGVSRTASLNLTVNH